MVRGRLCFRGIAVFLAGCSILALLVFSGCARKYDDARALFDEFCSVYGELPAGKLYSSEASEWDKDYLPDSIVYSMYGASDGVYGDEGDNSGASAYDYVEESVIYLCSSLDTFCELAVFICRDNTSTQAVARMCHARIGEVLALRQLIDTECAENARVAVIGNAVIMSVLPDAKKVETAITTLTR